MLVLVCVSHHALCLPVSLRHPWAASLDNLKEDLKEDLIEDLKENLNENLNEGMKKEQ